MPILLDRKNISRQPNESLELYKERKSLFKMNKR